MNHLVVAAVVCLSLTMLLGAVDGLYFHLWKYKLYAREETRYEHKLHTVRAVLFIPLVWLLFGKNYGGVWLWAGVLVAAADTAIEWLDTACEIKGRGALGGLSTGEYVTHLNASGLRLAALILILLAKPRVAWDLSAPWELLPAYPEWMTSLAFSVIPGAIGAVFLHLWLLREKHSIPA
jgi:hypothetical protein